MRRHKTIAQIAKEHLIDAIASKVSHIIRIPGGGKVLHPGTKEEANEHQRIIDARGAFVQQYIKEKGWSESFADLSIDQIMEIRTQEGWKNP